jgi:hypothetical protein
MQGHGRVRTDPVKESLLIEIPKKRKERQKGGIDDPTVSSGSKSTHRSKPKSTMRRYSRHVARPMIAATAAAPPAMNRTYWRWVLADAANKESPIQTNAMAAFGIMGIKPGARLLRSVLFTAQPKRTSTPTSSDKRPANGGRGWTKRERSAVKRVTSTRV